MIPTRIRAIVHAHPGDVDCIDDIDEHSGSCDLVCQLIQDAEQRAFRRSAFIAQEIRTLGPIRATAISQAIKYEAKEWTK